VPSDLGPDATLVYARAATGPLHQIRVHLARSARGARRRDLTGRPADPTLGRPMLPLAVLGFVPRRTGEYTEFRARAACAADI